MPVHPGAITHNRTTTGDVVVVGEVVNDSASGVEEVTVLIELADSNGAVVASGEAAVLSDVIAVKGSAPFAVTIAQARAYTEVRCRVLRAMPEVPERAVNRDLRVAEVAGRAVYDRTFVVNGKVRNIGDSPAVDVYVVVTLYGRDGAVLGAMRQPIENGVEAGSRALFEVVSVPVGWPVESFVVTVDGRIPVAEPTPDPESDPVGTASGSHPLRRAMGFAGGTRMLGSTGLAGRSVDTGGILALTQTVAACILRSQFRSTKCH